MLYMVVAIAIVISVYFSIYIHLMDSEMQSNREYALKLRQSIILGDKDHIDLLVNIKPTHEEEEDENDHYGRIEEEKYSVKSSIAKDLL